jgi:hypothetical protein
MSGVLRALSVDPPADIVNTPKNTVATVKSIAAMMTTTNRSIVRLPGQLLSAPHSILARVVSSAACGENFMPQCTRETLMHIFQRNSACATLNAAVALRNKLGGAGKVFGAENSFIGRR